MRGRALIVVTLASVICALAGLFMFVPLLRKVPGPISSEVAREFLVAAGVTIVFVASSAYVIFAWLIANPFTELLNAVARDEVSLAPWIRNPVTSKFATAVVHLRTALSDEKSRTSAHLQELQDTNAALIRLQAELVAADRLATVGKLSTGVAHEVGNPLSGILGYLSVIRPVVSAEVGALLDRVEAELARIDTTVRALLEIGRPSRGKPAPFDVRPTIDSAVRLVAAGYGGATPIIVESPDSLWGVGESGPLSQVLINLLLNALQAGGSAPVKVRAWADALHAHISVEDEGPGVPEAVAPRLFQPFFTTKAPGRGTGLGLAMSKHLLAQMGGGIAFANRPARGAAFTASLPLPASVPKSAAC